MEHQMIFKGTHCRVRFPQMREILIFALQEAADKNYQLSHWVLTERNDAFWYGIKDVIDTIYYDLDLEDKDPTEKIGYSLVNQEEAIVIAELMKAIDELYDIIGPKQPDSAYIDSPLWDKVVEAASAAFKIFMANEEEAKKTNPHPWQGEEDWGPDPEAMTEK